jgi:hypothetical protein
MDQPCIAELWYSVDENAWRNALKRYWTSGVIKASNLALEHSMDALDCKRVRELSSEGWFNFLNDEYFRWEYTAPNRYATTKRELRKYIENGKLTELEEIKNRLFTFDRSDIAAGLRTARQIRGLVPISSDLD